MELQHADLEAIYGPAAADALRGIEAASAAFAERFSEAFYAELAAESPVGEVIARLSQQEFEHLKQRQAEYLAELVSPDLTQEQHAEAAHRAGRMHAFVGVSPMWLIESFALYQRGIHAMLADALAPSQRREAMQHIIDARILYDLREQFASYDEIGRSVTAAVSAIDEHTESAANLSDLVRGVLTILGRLDGGISGFFARADAQGALQCEAAFGVAEHYYEAMQQGQIPKISIDPDIPAGQGPGGRAWRSGEVTVSNAWMLEHASAPWRPVGTKLGFRSSAAVPLRDETGRTIALFTLYSAYPGFFSSNRISKLLGHLHHVVGRAVAQRMHATVIPLHERSAFRRLLDSQRVAVLYQPVIDLRYGALVKIEALARLLDDDDDLIPADRFLPAFGESDLLELFSQVLHRACADLQTLERAGLRTRAAVNVPALALGDARYRDVLMDAIDDCALTPDRLTLEILETPSDLADIAKHHGFIAHLRELGIEVEQDDLGSAHSSLVRLDQYPFDGVKIDQALVRGAARNPQRALEFILYLSRLAHALAIPVTVEGLEHPGLIEAAALLGADRGQGFGIAMPMAAHELIPWHARYRYPVDTRAPRTALGAMAGYLLWDLQLGELGRWPDLMGAFSRQSSIVDMFIAERSLQGSALDELLKQAHAHARVPANEIAYRKTRAAIIDVLRAYALEEA